jgi:hypothetical protein
MCVVVDVRPETPNIDTKQNKVKPVASLWPERLVEHASYDAGRTTTSHEERLLLRSNFNPRHYFRVQSVCRNDLKPA